jgi:hypothetical protein
MAIAQNNIAKLIAEQIAVALAAQKSRRSQTSQNPNCYRQDTANRRRPDSADRRRLDSVIDTVKPLAFRDTHFRDSLIRGTKAQELSNGLDPTFNA